MYSKIISTVYLLASLCIICATELNLTFPAHFLLGCATSAYQIEGAWNVDGKGPSIWDEYTHTHPERIANHDNGDYAAKSYYKYKEDVKALKDMGMDVYRFSIAWTRILPTGLSDNINQKGIDYYNNLINELLQNGIKPMVTMYHWDLPQNLQNLGGWTNEIIVDYFELYAKVLFENFGDRVQLWVTINEPVFITLGYELDVLAPGINTFGVGPYLVARNIVKAHARAYHLYDEKFRAKQNGKVSLSLSTIFGIPLDPNSSSDKEAAETFMQFQVGLYAHPIFSKEGDHPQIVKDRVRNISLAQGFQESRLPTFTPEEVEYIRGTADFIGINEYTGWLITKNTKPQNASLLGDAGVNVYNSKDWIRSNNSLWLSVAPFTIRDVLNWYKEHYGDEWQLFITENGYSADGINDTIRVNFLGAYMVEILKAIQLDNCNVIGYTVWSLLDNFEWGSGYSSQLGVYAVDYQDPERRRTPKLSSDLLKSVTSTRKLSDKFLTVDNELNEIVGNLSLRNNLLIIG